MASTRSYTRQAAGAHRRAAMVAAPPGATWRACPAGWALLWLPVIAVLTMATHHHHAQKHRRYVGDRQRRRLPAACPTLPGSWLSARGPPPAWVLLPLIADTKWTTQSEYYKGSIFNNSYGAQKELGWLFTGKLPDDARFPPIVTPLNVPRRRGRLRPAGPPRPRATPAAPSR